MSITNATSLRKNLFENLSNVIKFNDTTIVTTKDGNAAIISEEYLRSLEETCYLNSIPGMTEKLLDGKATGVGDCVELDWENILK